MRANGAATSSRSLRPRAHFDRQGTMETHTWYKRMTSWPLRWPYLTARTLSLTTSPTDTTAPTRDPPFRPSRHAASTSALLHRRCAALVTEDTHCNHKGQPTLGCALMPQPAAEPASARNAESEQRAWGKGGPTAQAARVPICSGVYVPDAIDVLWPPSGRPHPNPRTRSWRFRHATPAVPPKGSPNSVHGDSEFRVGRRPSAKYVEYT